MTEFTDLEIEGDVYELSEDEAKETLAEFMDSHADNRDAYDSLQTEFSDLEDEKEDLEEKVTEFKEERAEEAAEYVNLPTDLVTKRFSFNEIEQIIDEGAEFSEESEEEDNDRITEFSEKPAKGRQDGSSTDRSGEKRGRAESLLSQKGFPTSD